MSQSSPADACPIDHNVISDLYTQEQPMAEEKTPDVLRQEMFDWYQKSGFRGCLFNKVAARDARRNDFTWLTPVEYDTTERLEASQVSSSRVINNFDKIIGEGDKPGLVSYMFPNVVEPRQLGNLIKLLHQRDPERFKLFECDDRVEVPELDAEFVGIQFRIKIGETDDGEDALSYPMIYNPWPFTTYARRFNVPMITFNRATHKQNPETPDSFVGVDDVDLALTPATFDRMLQKSLAVNKQAHSLNGTTDDSFHYSRKLFRAHNALVLPAEAWDN